MLKIIVNRCEPSKIKEIVSENDIFMSDADIYRVLNGETTFKGNTYLYEKMELLVDALVAASVNENVVIHSFNPLFFNWFHDNVAIDAFMMLDNSGKFVKIFSFERMLKKLEVMGAGEAVCDTDFSIFDYDKEGV